MAQPQTMATVDRLRDEIQGVRYHEATTTFCRLIAEQGRPLKDMIRQAIAAAAPYVQVPSHMMRLPTGEMRGVNYDHTILGWRGAIALMRELGGRRGFLPNVQAMWYVPQGLNVWEQVICEFPGHYARDGEQCNRKFPGPDEDINRFDGPAWIAPKIYFEDHEPIVAGSIEDRLARMSWAISEGDKEEAYGLFLGLAQEPEYRQHLKDAVLFAGMTCRTPSSTAAVIKISATGAFGYDPTSTDTLRGESADVHRQTRAVGRQRPGSCRPGCCHCRGGLN